jgi:pilus assembly protein CpaB
MAPMPSKLEVTKDAPKLAEPDFTEPKVPALIQAGQAAEVITSPESNLLGKPTMMLPLSSAVGDPPPLVANGATRVVPSIRPDTTVPTPLPPGGFFDSGFMKSGQPIGVGVLFAMVAFAIYSASMFAVDRQQRANWTLTQVVVAAEELGVGDVVTLENVALRAVPEPYHGSGVVRGDMMNFILDQKLAVGVQMGDPLFLSQFVSMRKADERLSKRVLKRTRGYTIETNAVSAVGRWVKPGDMVDVIVTIPGKQNSKGQVERRAVTLLQKVPVLATGKMADDMSEATLDERDKQFGHVTILLTAEEAEALTLGASVGRIKLTLRNGEDMEDDRNLDGAYTDSDTLLDGARQKVVRNKRQKIIQIIRNKKTGG